MIKTDKITIIGAGFGGLSTAIALQQLGMDAKVFESSPNRTSVDAGIVLGANAMNVLNTLGVGEKILDAGYTQDSYTLFSSNGRILASSNYVDPTVPTYTSIHRTKLLDLLISHLQPRTLYYNKKLTHFEENTDGIQLFFEDGTSEATDYLIAADGIHSTIRKQLFPDHALRFSGYTSWRGIIKNCPDDVVQSFSETWGSKGKIGLIPLPHHQIYMYTFKNCKPNDRELNEWRINDLLFNFYTYHAPIPQVLDYMTNEELYHQDIYDFKPLSQYKYNRILLVGDAAHTASPSMGQGANQAIEDALLLSHCLAQTKTVEQAFQQFEEQRIEYTRNFVKNAWRLGKASKRRLSSLWSIRDKLIQHKPIFR